VQDVERIRFLTGRAVLSLVEGALLLVGTATVLLLMNPPLAVLAMFASSLTVIGNSTRLARGRVGTENRPAE